MKLRKVVLNTVITKITSDRDIKPRTPLFIFKNDSFYNVLINGFKLAPYGTFSLNSEDMIAEFIEQGIEVVNDTTFRIIFPQTFLIGYEQPQSIELIETFIKFVD